MTDASLLVSAIYSTHSDMPRLGTPPSSAYRKKLSHPTTGNIAARCGGRVIAAAYCVQAS